MSQVRIDECLLNDSRFKEMVSIIEEEIDTITRAEAEEMAIGKCWRAFVVAQKYWRSSRSNVPKNVWSLRTNETFARLFVKTGFATEHEDGFYIAGSHDFFDWFHERKASGAKGGIESGKVRRQKAKQDRKTKRSKASEATKQNNRSYEAKTSKLEPVSVSVSVSDCVPVSVSAPVSVLGLTGTPSGLPVAPSEGAVAVVAKKLKPDKDHPTEGSAVWEAYRQAYVRQYNQEPVRNAKTNTQCFQLVQRVGVESAIKLVSFYLTHRKGYYTQHCHPLGACLQDAEGLHTQMLANYRVSESEARHHDKSQGNAQAFDAAYKSLVAKGVISGS